MEYKKVSYVTLALLPNVVPNNHTNYQVSNYGIFSAMRIWTTDFTLEYYLRTSRIDPI